MNFYMKNYLKNYFIHMIQNNNQNLLEEIWNKDRDLIIRTIYNIWISQPNSITLNKILETSQKLKDSLSYLVNSKYYDFSINLAFLASKKELLNLEQWTKERIRKEGKDFLENFIKSFINQFNRER